VKEKKILLSQVEVDECIKESNDNCLVPMLRSLIEGLIAKKKIPKSRLRLVLKKKSGTNITPLLSR
jgi:hypothetical protein